MKNDEIRAANRKALPKFLLFTLVCAVIGGIHALLLNQDGFHQNGKERRNANEDENRAFPAVERRKADGIRRRNQEKCKHEAGAG